MRRVIVAALAVLVVLAGIAALVPVALSSKLVKQRIADQIAAWTGRQVTFIGEPTIGFLPDLQIKIDNVTVGDPGSVKPLAAIPVLEGRIRIAPLLMGRIEIIEFRLIRPTINLRRDVAGKANWDLRPLQDDGGGPRIRNGPTLGLDLRKVRIRDASITYDNAASERHEEFTSTSLLAQWPSAADPVTGGGSFTWRGERVEFNGTVGSPLAMIEGRASPARFALASTQIRAVFTGNVSRLDAIQFSGNATLSTPSVRRLAAWLGATPPDSSVLGAGRIEGKLDWSGPTLSFSEAQLELDGNAADGAIVLDVGGSLPSVNGTLAFDTLDLSPYVEAYRATLSVEGPWQDTPIRLPALSLANADVRVSADEFLIGRWRGGRLAATGTLRDGAMSVQIGEAGLYGGTLTGTAKAAMEGDHLVASFAAKAAAIPAGPVLKEFADIITIDAQSTLSAEVAGSGTTWRSFLGSLAGTGDIALTNGTLSGFNLADLTARFDGAHDEPAASAATHFDAAASFKIAGGVASTDSLEADGNGFEIDIAGQASLETGVLNGTGTLTLTEPPPGQALPFELAGTWLAPDFYPDSARLIRRSEAKDGRTIADRTP